MGDVIVALNGKRRRITLLHDFGESEDASYRQFAIHENSQYINVTKMALRYDTLFQVDRPTQPRPLSAPVQTLLNELLAQNTRRPAEV